MSHRERHRTERVGWLRAAVLGANDGIVSTASLVVCVPAAHATIHDILVAGTAGLVAGPRGFSEFTGHTGWVGGCAPVVVERMEEDTD